MTAHQSIRTEGSKQQDWHRLTGEIIGAFFDVYNDLGFGLLENMYGAADLIIDHLVVVELKAGAFLPPGSKPQLINYLRVSGLNVGLLLWFGPVPEFKRVVVSGGRSMGNNRQ